MTDYPIYTIRPAALEDFDQVYDFINALEETVFKKDVLYEIFQKNIASDLNIYLVLSSQHGHITGYISCHGQYLLHHAGLVGEIQELFVLPDRRGKGLGKILVNAVKLRARFSGMVQLEVTANIKRTETHRFYEQQGFTETHKKFVCPVV